MVLPNQIKYLLNKILNRKLLVWLGLIFFAYALGTSLAYFFAPNALPKVYNFANPAANIQPSIEVTPQAISDFAIIQERNLFGLAKQQTAEEVSAPPVVAPSPENVANAGQNGTVVGILPLDARLVGTVDIDNPSLSRAIVIYNGTQKIVRNGDLFAGYTVKSIKRNEVIFELNGTELKLEQKLLK